MMSLLFDAFRGQRTQGTVLCAVVSTPLLTGGGRTWGRLLCASEQRTVPCAQSLNPTPLLTRNRPRVIRWCAV